MMIGTFITIEGESLKNLKQRMKLRGAKVTTGTGRCYSLGMSALHGGPLSLDGGGGYPVEYRAKRVGVSSGP
jgi:hypothetical protein